MKRIVILIIASCFILSLSGCETNRNYAYNDGYSEGYDVGYSDGWDERTVKAESDEAGLYDGSELDDAWEQGFDSGKESGYDVGYDDGYLAGSYSDEAFDNAEYEAIAYGQDDCAFHPEEALMIIEAYRNNEPCWGDGSFVTEQEYNEAIDALVSFYEYFYTR